MKRNSTIPSIEFVNRLGEEVVATPTVDSLDVNQSIDIPVSTATDFLEAVKTAASVKNETGWNQLLRMASDRVEVGRDNYWYLGELSRVAEHYGKIFASSGIVTFIQKYLDKVTSDVDWKELARFASVIEDEHTYRQACKKIGAMGSDIRSKKIRMALADMVKMENGIIVGDDINSLDRVESIESLKAKASESFNELLGKEIVAEGRRVASSNMEAIRKDKVDLLCRRVANIPDKTGWVKFYTSMFKAGEIGVDAYEKNLLNSVDSTTKEEIGREFNLYKEALEYFPSHAIDTEPDGLSHLEEPGVAGENWVRGMLAEGKKATWFNDYAEKLITQEDDVKKAKVIMLALYTIDREMYDEAVRVNPKLHLFLKRKASSDVNVPEVKKYVDMGKGAAEIAKILDMPLDLVEEAMSADHVGLASKDKKPKQWRELKKNKKADANAVGKPYVRYDGKVYRMINMNEHEVATLEEINSDETVMVPFDKVKVLSPKDADKALLDFYAPKDEEPKIEQPAQYTSKEVPLSKAPVVAPARATASKIKKSTGDVDKYIDNASKEVQSEVDDVKMGNPCLIQGDPANAFYGKTGIVEKVYKEGYIGIRLRNTDDYLLRFAEDIVSLPKEDYTIKNDSKNEISSLTKDISDTLAGGKSSKTAAMGEMLTVQGPKGEAFIGEVSDTWSDDATDETFYLLKNEAGEEMIAPSSWVVVTEDSINKVEQMGDDDFESKNSSRLATGETPLRDRPVKELSTLPPEKKTAIWDQFVDTHPELESKGSGFVRAVFNRWIWSDPSFKEVATSLFPKGD